MANVKVMYAFKNIPITYDQIAVLLGRKKSSVGQYIRQYFDGDIDEYLAKNGIVSSEELIDRMKKAGMTVGIVGCDDDDNIEDTEVSTEVNVDQTGIDDAMRTFDDSMKESSDGVDRILSFLGYEVREDTAEQDELPEEKKTEKVSIASSERKAKKIAGIAEFNACIAAMEKLTEIDEISEEIRRAVAAMADELRSERRDHYDALVDWNEIARRYS